jgi:hypothetical protein
MVAGCAMLHAGAALAVDRQIAVNPVMSVTWSYSAGEPTVRTAQGRGLNAGFWQRSSGAKAGVGSNNVATIEFQLPEVAPARIRSARYEFSGVAIQCAGNEPVVFDVYAYAGDGKADIADATAGGRVAQLSADCRDKPAFARPIDVTNIVRQRSVPSGVRHVGFNIRKANNRLGPSFMGIHPGKLTIVVADQDVAKTVPAAAGPGVSKPDSVAPTAGVGAASAVAGRATSTFSSRPVAGHPKRAADGKEAAANRQ